MPDEPLWKKYRWPWPWPPVVVPRARFRTGGRRTRETLRRQHARRRHRTLVAAVGAAVALAGGAILAAASGAPPIVVWTAGVSCALFTVALILRPRLHRPREPGRLEPPGGGP